MGYLPSDKPTKTSMGDDNNNNNNNNNNKEKDESSSPKGVAVVVFNNTPLYRSWLVFTSVSFLGWFINVLWPQCHYHVDFLGCGAFALAALPHVRSSPLPRVRLSSLAVVVWGTKSAAYLLYRVLQHHQDNRLTDTLQTLTGNTIFWTISWVWNMLCSLPHTLGTTSSSPGDPFLVMMGFALFDFGFAVETMADYQKWQFKQQQAPHSFCNVGLWRYSQQPNYFGNLLLWCGILLLNASSLSTSRARYCAAFLSPLFLWILFSGEVNGTVGVGAQLAWDRYGHDPAYLEYRQTVAKIIPFIY